MTRTNHAVKLTLLFAFLIACGSSTFAEPGARKKRRPRPERVPDKLKQGDVAPDFKLKSVDGKRQVHLSSFRGQRPVALIFGSYT